jgi:hypothetical protein
VKHRADPRSDLVLDVVTGLFDARRAPDPGGLHLLRRHLASLTSGGTHALRGLVGAPGNTFLSIL